MSCHTKSEFFLIQRGFVVFCEGLRDCGEARERKNLPTTALLYYLQVLRGKYIE